MNHSEQPWPEARYAWYVSSVLTLCYVFSYIDRQIFSLLIEPIRTDLGFTDTQISLMGGFAFAIFYGAMGIPLGRLADRSGRVGLIGIGIVVWSLMTCACGLAKNFWQMFLARVGVGIGEAALAPSAISIIADYFPPEKRTRPLGMYMMAVPVGPGLAFITGGLVIEMVKSAGQISLPVIGDVSAWQIAFFAVGLPGLLVALLSQTIREPVRRGMTKNEHGEAQLALPLSSLLAFLFKENGKTFGLIFISFGFFAINFAALIMWLPTFFVRTYHWEISRIGISFGPIFIIFGCLGIYLSTVLIDRLKSSNYNDAYLRAIFIMITPTLPLFVLLLLMPSANAALLLLIPATCLMFSVPAAMPIIVQAITPNQLRGQVMAVFAFTNNIIGLLVGPTVVALITDYVFSDPADLRYSLIIVSSISIGLGVILLGMAFKPFSVSLEKYNAKVEGA